MIKLLVKLKKYILSNIRIRKLVHYKKELSSDDSFAYELSPDLNGNVSLQYLSTTPSDIVKLFKFEEKISINENTACIIASIKNEPAGCIFLKPEPLARLLAPFIYEIKLGVNSAYAHTLFIDKRFRGYGLAKLLYLESFKRLSKNFKLVHVITETENFIANNMVTELGFKKCRSFVLIKIFNIKVHYAINNVFEKNILSFLIYLVKKAYRIIRCPISFIEKMSYEKDKLFFKLFIITALNTDGNITVAYFTKKNVYLPLAHRIFPNGYEIKKNKTFYQIGLNEEINELTDKVDLLIIEDDIKRLYRQFKSHEGIKFIPKLVLQRNNHFVDIEDLLKNKDHGLKHDIKAAKKNEYSYIFTKDKILFKFFYDHMYVPYISNRHNNFAFVDSFNLVFSSFKKGGLIFLKHKNRFLSGAVVKFKNKEMHNKYFGVLNGDISLIKRNVLSALYYFCFKFAQENGFCILDCGYSRSFLNDGVLRYKDKWNTTVKFDNVQRKAFFLKLDKLTNPIKEFLIKNPFISLDGEKHLDLIGNIFLDNEMFLEKDKYVNRLKVQGLQKIKVYNLNGTNNIKEAVSVDFY